MSAYAVLARVSLVVNDFELAEMTAIKSLEIYNELMDYNLLRKDVNASFQKGNKEILFDASTLTSGIINPTIAKIDSSLYSQYHEMDLRKQLFYKLNTDRSYAFRGHYTGEVNSSSFAGIAVDEVYLTLAEAYVRNNKIVLGMQKLNELLVSRWEKDKFIPFEVNKKDDALEIVLQERRKELVMRNIRWMDLKRLNQEPPFRNTLKRVLGGKEYTLLSGDLRYAFLIPSMVMGRTNLEQNPR